MSLIWKKECVTQHLSSSKINDEYSCGRSFSWIFVVRNKNAKGRFKGNTTWTLNSEHIWRYTINGFSHWILCWIECSAWWQVIHKIDESCIENSIQCFFLLPLQHFFVAFHSIDFSVFCCICGIIKMWIIPVFIFKL